MKQLYIKRTSYKSLRFKNPLLSLDQLKAERKKVLDQHKNRLAQTIKGHRKLNFDSVYLKKRKQCHKLNFKSKTFETSMGIKLNMSLYSNLFLLENIQSPTNHSAWALTNKNKNQSEFSHILLSTEKVKKGSQLEKFQNRFK